MRRTLYCVEVIPHPRVMRCATRLMQSAVRIRLSKASSAVLAKGFCWAISFFNLDTAHSRFLLPSRRGGADIEMAAELLGMRLLLDDLQLNGEFDVVADHGGGGIGTDAEILALDGGGGGVAGVRFVIHARHGGAGTFDLELD